MSIYLLTMNISILRSEIKSWERDFKSKHGKHPSVQDIKQQPVIGTRASSWFVASESEHIFSSAEKYKLYKKLSKAPAASDETRPVDPPSTPLRSQKRDRHPSLLLSKPRVVDTITASITSNPFSPVKNKGKQKEASSILRSQDLTRTRPNLFSTPSKGPKSDFDSGEASPDDDELPAIIPFHPIASSSAQLHPPAQNAVSRARKRLRGEPVSPSPNKEKRRRVGSSHISLPFAKLGTPVSASDDENDAEDEIHEVGGANSSFIDDSPVKAPAGGKSFRLLFEETLPKIGIAPVATATKLKGSLSRSKSKSVSVSAGLFGDRLGKAANVSTLVKEDVDQGNGVTAASTHLAGDIRKGTVISKPLFVTASQDDLFSSSDTRHPPGSEIEPRKSTNKRLLSDIDADTEDDIRNGTQITAPIIPRLLPPSPPPVDSSRGSSKDFRDKGKGKAVADTGRSRKKAKMQEKVHDDEEEDSSEEVQVKLVGRNGPKRLYRALTDNPNFEFDYDSDPIMPSHRGLRDEGAARVEGQDDDTNEEQSKLESGKFEVDLPDKLRRVLALSPSRGRESKEERVVRGLLSGVRAIHYDAAKGGEIWDVGEEEVEHRGGDTEGEDDWEGEPVPWEVGEL